jgi:hypothetical protein
MKPAGGSCPALARRSFSAFSRSHLRLARRQCRAMSSTSINRNLYQPAPCPAMIADDFQQAGVDNHP